MLQHAGTLLWLRWVLFRRSLTKKTSALSFMVTVIVCVALALAAGGLALLLFFLAMLGAFTEKPWILVCAIDGMLFVFFFVWFISMTVELQRTEIIDFRKMLYLPVSLKVVFLLNFLLSLFTPSLIFFSLPALGLTLGLAVAFGPRMLLALPIGMALFLTVAAWTYYVKGVLAVLMENKRRRRVILVVLPMIVALGGQVPYLLGVSFGLNTRHGSDTDRIAKMIEAGEDNREIEKAKEEKEARDEERLDKVIQTVFLANTVVPIGWLALGIHALAVKGYGTASLCFLGFASLAAGGLGVGYRSTQRYYRGISGKKKAEELKEKPDKAPAARKRRLVERTLPFLDDDTAAYTWTAFVNYARHPQIRMFLLSPLFMCFFLYLFYKMNASGGGFGIARILAPPLMPVMCVFMSSMLMCNVFGTDGAGFRLLVLLPTPRQKYLIGKNLAFFPFLALQVVFFLVVVVLILRPSLMTLLLACTQTLQLYLSYCILGNVLSLYFPFHIRPDAMRAQTNKGLMFLGTLLAFLLTPFLTLPTVIAVGADFLGPWLLGTELVSLGLLISLVFLALTFLFYRLSLKSAGAILLEREQRILETLTKDKE